ncbi:hypothetical protein EWS92_21500 [Vibrio vulnificus]|uniref:hypothetical protein n=1 Tax=Vibrio vulnificus TaxID=672 RepID=UPI000BA16B09|nr:hypothetical protein [Vibrio vulnificus]EGQ9696260.1 hypothetical protein [Vibrio parahaemolyticus]EGR0790988.1 hypothetical protein [Vibrio vulnificus]EGR0799568.1 hypothetical protein [Vibrio vulnificus]EGR0817048.1 hypothetical protein [Vibrio vulnificus]EGR0828814.1 hypothetical protein [Vibrio vulnificus]
MDLESMTVESLRLLLEQELRQAEGLLEHFGFCPQFVGQLENVLNIYDALTNLDKKTSSTFASRIQILKNQL